MVGLKSKQLYNKKRNAKQRDIEFTVSSEALSALKGADTCVYTGVPFDDHNRMSIERLDNDKGYEPGNLIPVTIYANVSKSGLDVMDIVSPQTRAAAVSMMETYNNRIANLKAVREEYQRMSVQFRTNHDKLRKLMHAPDDFKDADYEAAIRMHISKMTSAAEHISKMQTTMFNAINVFPMYDRVESVVRRLETLEKVVHSIASGHANEEAKKYNFNKKYIVSKTATKKPSLLERLLSLFKSAS